MFIVVIIFCCLGVDFGYLICWFGASLVYCCDLTIANYICDVLVTANVCVLDYGRFAVFVVVVLFTVLGLLNGVACVLLVGFTASIFAVCFVINSTWLLQSLCLRYY